MSDYRYKDDHCHECLKEVFEQGFPDRSLLFNDIEEYILQSLQPEKGGTCPFSFELPVEPSDIQFAKGVSLRFPDYSSILFDVISIANRLALLGYKVESMSQYIDPPRHSLQYTEEKATYYFTLYCTKVSDD